MFAMHSHLLGQIVDIDPDRASGRKTTAVVIGITASKALIAGLLLAEAVIIHYSIHNLELTLFLAIAGFGFIGDTIIRPNRLVTNRQLRVILLVWNAVAVLSMYWIWKEGVFSTHPYKSM